jgi:hypothetical protein
VCCERALQLHLMHLIAFSPLCFFVCFSAMCCERALTSYTECIFLASPFAYLSVCLQCVVKGLKRKAWLLAGSHSY